MSLQVLLALRGRRLVNSVRSLRRDWLKVGVVGVLGGALLAGLFAATFESFVYLHDRIPTEDAQRVISAGFSLFFFVLLLMLIFSNAIIAYGSQYRNEETAHLLALPVEPATVYAYKLIESVTFSSWAFCVLGLPIMLSYGIVFGAGLVYYAALPFLTASLVAIPAGVGALAGMAVAVLFPRGRASTIRAAGLMVLMGLAVVAFFYVRPQALDPQEWVEGVVGRLSVARSSYSPSFWATLALIDLCEGRWSPGAWGLWLLACTGCLSLLAADAVARRCYSWAYSRAQGGSTTRRKPGRLADALAWPLRLFSKELALIVAKDMRTFARDPAQWSQGAIFFGLLAVYVANLRSYGYNLASGFWQNLIAFLNLAATSLTLATLTTRFVFPMVSLEGRSFWLLGLAPMRRRRVLQAKFVVALLTSLVVTECLIVGSNLMLGTPRAVMALQVATVGFVCVGLSGIAAGLSAVFPTFKETSPSRIVSGFGGTVTLIVSLGYVVIIVAIEAVPSHLYLVHRTVAREALLYWVSGSVGAILLLSAVACALPMWLGIRALERMEFGS